MKPIKTKLTPDQIFALDKLMEQLPDYQPKKELEKVTKSILMDCEDKIHTRYRKILKSQDIFNQNKTVSLELKYHEAFALTIFIELQLPTIPALEKKHNDLLMLRNYLHPKLL